MTIGEVAGMQSRHGVTLMEIEQGNWRLTTDGLSFLRYWKAVQPLRPYLWTMCPWASAANAYEDDDEPRYWISRQNLHTDTRARIGNARRRTALSALGDAASLLAEAISTARAAGCTGIIVARMDSGYYNSAVCHAAVRAGAYFSVTARIDPAVKAAIASIPEGA
jgi:hypothetical protein